MPSDTEIRDAIDTLLRAVDAGIFKETRLTALGQMMLDHNLSLQERGLERMWRVK